MGIGEFLILAIIIICIYSLINKCVNIFKNWLQHNIDIEKSEYQANSLIKDFKNSDFE